MDSIDFLKRSGRLKINNEKFSDHKSNSSICYPAEGWGVIPTNAHFRSQVLRNERRNHEESIRKHPETKRFQKQGGVLFNGCKNQGQDFI